VIEHCERCLRLAPSWGSAGYAEWHELTDAQGRHLGLVCLSCLADGELLLLHAEVHYASSA